jgi:hypothetical protein
VPTGVLVAQELAPLLNTSQCAEHPSLSSSFCSCFDKSSGGLNGIGVTASRWVQALETLTGTTELEFLTLLTWKALLPHRGLLRAIKAWCPGCYQEWQTLGLELSESLLWAFAVVTICPRHQRPLSDKCPRCARSLPLLGWYSRPGYCSTCQQWLGEHCAVVLSESEALATDELKWHTWIFHNLSDILAAAPRLSALPLRENIAKGMAFCIHQATNGNQQAFARLVYTSITGPCDWLAGRALPQLPMLLRICYCLQIPLLNFLMADFQAATAMLLTPLPVSQQSRRTHRPFPAAHLQLLLESALSTHPPLSLEKVAHRAGYRPSDLSKYFPDLCRAISWRYQHYCQAHTAQKVEIISEHARQVVFDLYAEGVYPSNHQVQARLPKRGYMRSPRIRAVVLQARRDLDLEP